MDTPITSTLTTDSCIEDMALRNAIRSIFARPRLHVMSQTLKTSAYLRAFSRCVLLIGVTLPPATALAADWGTLATISDTLGVQADRLCLGEASRGDIGCPTYAPKVTSTGLVVISQSDVGSGNGLRLHSSTPAVSMEIYGGASPRDGGNSAITLATTSSDLNLISAYRTNLRASGGAWGTPFLFDLKSPLLGTSVQNFVEQKATWAPVSDGYAFIGHNQEYTINQSGTASGSYTAQRIRVIENPALPESRGNALLRLQLGNADRFLVTPGGRVIVGQGVNPWPSATLQVSGSVRLSADPSATLNICDSDRLGAIRYQGGNFQICRNGSTWETLVAGATGMMDTDRITSSSTAGVIANQAGGTVSFTLGSTAGAAYLHPTLGLVAPGVSATGPISGTDGYFSARVGVGTVPHPSFTLSLPTATLGTMRGARIVVGYGGDTSSFASSSDTQMGNAVTIMNGGSLLFYAPATYGLNTRFSMESSAANELTVSTPATSANTRLRFLAKGTSQLRTSFDGSLGVGTSDTVPSTSLHVSGTLRIADGGEACDANRLGAIRYRSSSFQICRNGSTWETLVAGNSGSVDTDRITSGTTQIIINGTANSISFTVGGVTTGYFDAGKLVASGVSTTGPISGTDGYFAGRVGIQVPPDSSYGLNVSGTINISSSIADESTLRLGHVYHYIARKGTTNEYHSSGYHNFTGNYGNILKLTVANRSSLFFGPVTMNDRLGLGVSTPSTTLQVSGTLQIGDGGEACDANRLGAIRYRSSSFQICRNGSTWETLVAGGTGTLESDRIVSGTSAAIVGPNGNVMIRGLLDIVTGTGVVGVGQGAAVNGATSNTTAIGNYAAQNNSGGYVTAVGQAAGRYNTAALPTFVGVQAGANNSGVNAVAVGSNAAISNSGANGSFVGASAGESNIGASVSAFGVKAAQNNTGNSISAFGANAGSSNTFNNVTLLGYNATRADKNNQVVLGGGSIVEVSTSGVYVGKGISTSGPAFIGAKAQVSGSIQLASDPAETCGPSTYGTIKVVEGRLWICRAQ